MKYLLLLLLSTQAHAFTDNDLTHFAAHAGTSFALQTVFYGVNNQYFGLSKPWAEGLGFAETLAIGFAYKALETNPPNTGTAMLENSVGALGAIGTHVVFHF